MEDILVDGRPKVKSFNIQEPYKTAYRKKSYVTKNHKSKKDKGII